MNDSGDERARSPHASATELLGTITHCPVVLACRAGATHPCSDIVGVQEHKSLERHQVPEPWSGAIEQAPILFVSSNPSISTDEPYPDMGWQPERVRDFSQFRFGGGPDHLPFVKDGIRFPLKDGGHSKRPVPFWAAVRQRSRELLGTKWSL